MKWALFTRNLKKEEKGATIIEFAIIAPILFLVLMGIVDVGLIFMGRTFLDSGAREAARFGITGQTQGAGSREDQIRNIIYKNSFGLLKAAKLDIRTLSYGSLGALTASDPCVDSACTARVNVNNGNTDPDQGSASLGLSSQTVVYLVSYRWQLITPFLSQLYPQGILLSSVVVSQNEPY